jgi:serine/threonine protein kinase
MTLEEKSILHGRYQIEGLLGHGGMGAVYQAFDTLYDRPCAIKELCLSNLPREDKPQAAPAGDSFSGQQRTSSMTRMKAISLFKREAKLLAALDHPHLPKVNDYFSIGDDYYLVMTLIEGKDLRKLIEDRQWLPFPEAVVLAWTRQIIDALNYCHTRGLIHRDVKPSNILVCENDNVYLVDFGVAKYTDPGANTGSLLQVLTPRYSPPEQYTGEGLMDARVDIYSLGATLYTLLTGQQPMDAVSRLTGGNQPAPRQIIPTLSVQMDAVINKAMALDPVERFASLKDMSAELFKSAAAELLPKPAPEQKPALSKNREDISTVIYPVQHRGSTPEQKPVSTTVPPPPPPPQDAVLHILGPDKPHKFTLKRPTTRLGRLSQGNVDIDIDLAPFDEKRIISRHHAFIELYNGQYYLVDDNSHNGTWLNGRKLVPGERNQLVEADTIKFGSIQPHGIQAIFKEQS